jgi:hypothetical protein
MSVCVNVWTKRVFAAIMEVKCVLAFVLRVSVLATRKTVYSNILLTRPTTARLSTQLRNARDEARLGTARSSASDLF